MVGVKQLKIALYISANLRDVVIGQNEQQLCLVQVSDDKIYLNRVRIRISFVWKQGQHPQRILTLSTQKNPVLTLTYYRVPRVFPQRDVRFDFDGTDGPGVGQCTVYWSTGLHLVSERVNGPTGGGARLARVQTAVGAVPAGHSPAAAPISGYA